MTTIKIGSQDATGFHPTGDGTIVDPGAVETTIDQSPSIASKLATKANATALAAKLDKTEAASTYITVAAGNATYVPKWKASTAYSAGDKVLSPNGDVVSAIANFTSGTSFNAANWNLSTSYTTPAQAAGLGAALSIVFGG